LCIVVPLPPGTYPLAVNNNNNSNSTIHCTFTFFLGAFSNSKKLQLASSCLSVRMEKLSSHETEFDKTNIHVFLENVSRKYKFY
jgi:hypothetical protein